MRAKSVGQLISGKGLYRVVQPVARRQLSPWNAAPKRGVLVTSSPRPSEGDGPLPCWSHTSERLRQVGPSVLSVNGSFTPDWRVHDVFEGRNEGGDIRLERANSSVELPWECWRILPQ